MRALRFLFAGAVLLVLHALPPPAQDDGQAVPRAQYADRDMLPDPTAAPCPDTPRSPDQGQPVSPYEHRLARAS